jgi:hypothetical protein
MIHAQAEFDAISTEMKANLTRLATSAAPFVSGPVAMDVKSDPSRLTKAVIMTEFALKYRDVAWLSVLYDNTNENEILQPYVPALRNFETEIKKRVESYYAAACAGQVVARYAAVADSEPWHFTEYSKELLKLLVPGSKSAVDWSTKPLPVDLSAAPRALEHAFVTDMLDLIRDPIYKVPSTDETPIKTLQSAIAANCAVWGSEIERYVFGEYAAALRLLIDKSAHELAMAAEYNALLTGHWSTMQLSVVAIVQRALAGITAVSLLPVRQAAKQEITDNLRTFATAQLESAVLIMRRFVLELPILSEIKGAPTQRNGYYLSTYYGARLTHDLYTIFAPILKQKFPDLQIVTPLQIQYNRIMDVRDTPIDRVYVALVAYYNINPAIAQTGLYYAALRFV